jgi:hypothetical protein
VATTLSETDEDDDESAEQFVVQLSAFPLPGHVTGGEES